MVIEIKNLTKVSFNKYNHLHWAKKKEFKDALRILVMSSHNKKYEGGYTLNFEFEFIGRKLDTINVSHYCKIIEDYLFKQDNKNRQICINVSKGTVNKCTLTLIKL